MRTNKIGHRYKCKCKLCPNIKDKSDEIMINYLERYYLKTLVKGFKFNKIRGKKPKRRLIIYFIFDEVFSPFRNIGRLVNCRKCKQLKQALEGYRWSCAQCAQENTKNRYAEWKSWGNSSIV